MRVALALIGLLSVWLATSATDAQTPVPDLVISEVLPNAGQGSRDADFEWVEIENRSQRAISLDGWALEDNNARDALPAISVPAGGFVLVVGSEDGAEALTAALAAAGVEIGLIDDGRIGTGLANTGDRLLLIDPSGATVDGISWGTDRSMTESIAPAAGLSLSRGVAPGALMVGVATPGAPAPTVAGAPPAKLPPISASRRSSPTREPDSATQPSSGSNSTIPRTRP